MIPDCEGLKYTKMFLNINLKDLNPYLMCVLCGGYYIDATTIVECLHTFCRSCIVKHLESSKYCPICEVMVHKTKPLVNIRRDKTLQSIVYNLIPGLYERELKQRDKFYTDRPHYVRPADLDFLAEGPNHSVANEKNITVSLRYHETASHNQDNPNLPRFFRCPVAVTIRHLKKLILSKFELGEESSDVQLYLNDKSLPDDLTLMDIACLYHSGNRDNLDLTYVLYEKKNELEDKKPDVISAPQLLEKEPVIEKEVLLQITESGLMSVSEMDSSQIIGCTELDSVTPPSEIQPEKPPFPPSETNLEKPTSMPSEPGKPPIPKESEPGLTAELSKVSEPPKVEKPVSEKPVECSRTMECTPDDRKQECSDSAGKADEKENVTIKPKRPSVSEDCSPMAKKPMLHEEKNLIIPEIGSSEIVLKMSGSTVPKPLAENAVTRSSESLPSTSISDSLPSTSQSLQTVSASSSAHRNFVAEKPEISVEKLKEVQGISNATNISQVWPIMKPPDPMIRPPPTNWERPEKPPVHRPIHKSIRSSPQIWNPTIPKEKLRPTLMKNSDEPRKQAKFFKARQVPRFLGNPASGVKPMYSNGLPPAEPPMPPVRKLDQIVRVDPKTLRALPKDEKKTPNALLSSPFIPRDNHFVLPDPKTKPYSTVNLPPGFHASLPPSVSLLMGSPHHYRSMKASEATKSCDRKSESQQMMQSASTSSSSSLPPPSSTSSSSPCPSTSSVPVPTTSTESSLVPPAKVDEIPRDKSTT